MKFFLDLDIKPPKEKVVYHDKIMAVGSCFTEHIGGRLHDLKFQVLQNPNGILFDPLSVASSLQSYIDNKIYKEDELFFMGDLWQSWQHHSKFSGAEKHEVLNNINTSQKAANGFLSHANWLIVTLGSSFAYRLADTNEPVANCHKAPAQTFVKSLTNIDIIVASFNNLITSLKEFNPAVKLIFTISPVRHIRDGVVENSRSKARLVEAVQILVAQHEHVHYFPAYELVIDVLRDYRFYDMDLVHPNYAATEFVFEKFTTSYIDVESQSLMNEVRKIISAFRHKPFHPSSEAHKVFIEKNLQQVLALVKKYPNLDFQNELEFFKRRR